MKVFTSSLVAILCLLPTICSAEAGVKRGSASCGLVGYEKNGSALLSTSTKAADLGWTGCSSYCKKTKNCKSYAVGKKSCRLYKSNVSGNFKSDSTSPFKFYDLSCKAPASSTTSRKPSTSSVHSSTQSISKIGSSTATTTKPTTTSQATRSSTSLSSSSSSSSTKPSTVKSTTSTSSSVVPSSSSAPISTTSKGTTSTGTSSSRSSSTTGPGNSDFTKTYTYEDGPLPTVTQMGEPPITTGIGGRTSAPSPVSSCIIDPAASGSTFKLLDAESGIPLIKKSQTALGPAPSPTSEAEANALGPPESYNAPSFRFVSSGSSGLYDLVLAESPPLYIGKTDSGDVVLTSSSTGVQGSAINGRNVATSIFSATCNGRIVVTQAGQKYNWTLSGDTTAMKPFSSTNGTMFTLPDAAVSTAKRRLHRRNMYTEGKAPRCPATPNNLVAKVKPGARDYNPNGCGSQDGLSKMVPNLGFESCCNGHDNCYDDCSTETFEKCNTDFLTCMTSSGCEEFSAHWTTWTKHLACIYVANFYYWVVTTSVGVNAFYGANDERCACYCSDPEAMCVLANGSKQCVDIHGTDASNCGACGRTCPTNSKCINGECVCPHDQCSNRCVDFQTHPQHCGSCDNVCTSGYCSAGTCAPTPSSRPPTSTSSVPKACATNEGFRDGKFTSGLSDWAWSNSVSDSDHFEAETDDSSHGTVGAYFKTLIKNKPSGLVTAATWVTVCPNTTYLFTGDVRRMQGDDYCGLNVKWGGKYAVLWGGTALRTASLNSSWVSYSPQLLRAIAGPDGENVTVAADGHDLDVKFELYMSCGYDKGGVNEARVDNFAIRPQT